MSKVLRRTVGPGTLLLAAALAGCSPAVLTVNGQSITRAQLDAKLESNPLATNVLHQMAQEALIRQYAQQHHIVISDAQIQAREDQIKASYGAQWPLFLQSRGLTEQDVHNDLELNLIVEQALGNSVNVSDAQIRQFFAQNHALFDVPAKVCASHILVASLPAALKIRALLKPDGSNFADIAERYSTDPGSKVKGGSLGCFPHGQMTPAFDQAAFALPVGRISPPVRSPFGWHIILVTSKQPAQRATLASAYPRIRAQLLQQREQPLLSGFLQRLESAATITAQDPRYASLASSPAPSTAPAAAPVVPSQAPSPH